MYIFWPLTLNQHNFFFYLSNSGDIYGEYKANPKLKHEKKIFEILKLTTSKFQKIWVVGKFQKMTFLNWRLLVWPGCQKKNFFFWYSKYGYNTIIWRWNEFTKKSYFYNNFFTARNNKSKKKWDIEKIADKKSRIQSRQFEKNWVWNVKFLSWGEGNVHGQLAGSGIIRGQFSSAGRLARTNCSGDNYPKSCPASCNMIAYHAIPPKHLFQLSCQKRSYAAILPSGKSLSRKVYEISIKTIGFLTNFSTNNRRCPRFFISNLPLVSCNPLEVLWLETYLFFISFFENYLPYDYLA